MNYCKSCSTNYTDEYIKENLINTETKTNVFQCTECFDVDNIVKLFGYGEKCSICLDYNSNAYFDECKHCFSCSCIYGLNFKCPLCNTLNNKVMYCNNMPLYFNNLRNSEIKNLFMKCYANTFEIFESEKYSHDFRYKIYVEYYKWLLLLIDNDNNNNVEKISPSNLINQLWCAHILDLDNYMKCCVKMCGYVLHHYVETNFKANIDKYTEQFNRTFSKYLHKFEVYPIGQCNVWKPIYEINISRVTMTVFVKLLTGKTISIDVNLSDSVSELRDRISQKINEQVLCAMIYAGRQLQDDKPLLLYRIQHQSTVHCVLNLRGC